MKITFNKITKQYDVIELMYRSVIASFNTKKEANRFKKTNSSVNI